MTKRIKIFLTLCLTACLSLCLGIFAACQPDNNDDNNDGNKNDFTVTVLLPDNSPATGAFVVVCNPASAGGMCLAPKAVDANGKITVDVTSLIEAGTGMIEVHFTKLPEGYIYVDEQGVEFTGNEGLQFAASSGSATIKLASKATEPEVKDIDVTITAVYPDKSVAAGIKLSASEDGEKVTTDNNGKATLKISSNGLTARVYADNDDLPAGYCLYTNAGSLTTNKNLTLTNDNGVYSATFGIDAIKPASIAVKLSSDTKTFTYTPNVFKEGWYYISYAEGLLNVKVGDTALTAGYHTVYAYLTPETPVNMEISLNENSSAKNTSFTAGLYALTADGSEAKPLPIKAGSGLVHSLKAEETLYVVNPTVLNDISNTTDIEIKGSNLSITYDGKNYTDTVVLTPNDTKKAAIKATDPANVITLDIDAQEVVYPEFNLDENDFTVPANEDTYIAMFTASEDGWYVFTTYNWSDTFNYGNTASDQQIETVGGESEYVVAIQMTAGQTIYVQIGVMTLGEEAERTCIITYSETEPSLANGTEENPYVLTLSANTFITNGFDYTYLTFTAEEAGTYLFTPDADLMYEYWNMSENIDWWNPDGHGNFNVDTDETVTNKITLSAGQQILIAIQTSPYATHPIETPDYSVTITVSKTA